VGTRTVKRISAIVIVCIGLSIILPELWSTIIVSGAVRDARALLDPNAPERVLPARVTVTFDGATATFHRGDTDYATLLSVLRAVRSPKALEAAGAYPSPVETVRCGDVAITSFAVRFHFLLSRSANNPHYLWLHLPHLNRGGFGLPLLIDDGRLAPLVQSAATREHRSAK
jgi:hypothetical protein